MYLALAFAVRRSPFQFSLVQMVSVLVRCLLLAAYCLLAVPVYFHFRNFLPLKLKSSSSRTESAVVQLLPLEYQIHRVNASHTAIEAGIQPYSHTAVQAARVRRKLRHSELVSVCAFVRKRWPCVRVLCASNDSQIHPSVCIWPGWLLVGPASCMGRKAASQPTAQRSCIWIRSFVRLYEHTGGGSGSGRWTDAEGSRTVCRSWGINSKSAESEHWTWPPGFALPSVRYTLDGFAFPSPRTFL